MKKLPTKDMPKTKIQIRRNKRKAMIEKIIPETLPEPWLSGGSANIKHKVNIFVPAKDMPTKDMPTNRSSGFKAAPKRHLLF